MTTAPAWMRPGVIWHSGRNKAGGQDRAGQHGGRTDMRVRGVWCAALSLAIGALYLPPARAADPVRGGTLTFGIHAGDPPTYDCHISPAFSIIHPRTPHYPNLLKIDPTHYPDIV